jgi:plastocyanin
MSKSDRATPPYLHAMKLRRLSLLGAVVVAVGLTGCGGGNGNEQAETSGSSSSTQPVVKTVKIDESEFKLTPSSVSLPKTGAYEFKVVNKGSITHALEVEGKGVEEESDKIGAGNSATLDVTFKEAGSYEMYCPVDGHKDQGMKGTITVGAGGSSGGSTTTGETTTTETDTGGGGY